jgi:hypothetical protein
LFRSKSRRDEIFAGLTPACVRDLRALTIREHLPLEGDATTSQLTPVPEVRPYVPRLRVEPSAATRRKNRQEAGKRKNGGKKGEESGSKKEDEGGD